MRPTIAKLLFRHWNECAQGMSGRILAAFSVQLSVLDRALALFDKFREGIAS